MSSLREAVQFVIGIRNKKNHFSSSTSIAGIIFLVDH